MELRDRPIYKYYQEYGKFLHACLGVLVVICLISMNVFLYHDSQLKKEISQTCGWAEEDYECYCEKGEAIRLKNLMDKDLIINYTVEEADVLEHDEGDYKYGWEE